MVTLPDTHGAVRIQGLKGLKLSFVYVGLENKTNAETAMLRNMQKLSTDII